MSTTRADRVVDELLLRHGRTYADEIGADLVSGGPDALFRLLVFALLASTRIRAHVAVDACRALVDAGMTTPTAMAQVSWADRTRVLNRSGYARYDESTSRRLEDVSRHVLHAYGGDLARLREAAHHDPSEERSRLREFVGVGPVGADIFLREAQLVWDELRPYVDSRALSTARELGLSDDPAELAALVPAAEVARLVAALVRARLNHDVDEVRRVVDAHTV
jgi:endonuclease III